VNHGFVRTSDGNITTFDPTGSLTTQPGSIDSSGEITGFYQYPTHVIHGFVLASDGTITSFAAAGSLYTYPSSIAYSGVTGYYRTRFT
jgi:hypothetical protein